MKRKASGLLENLKFDRVLQVHSWEDTEALRLITLLLMPLKT